MCPAARSAMVYALDEDRRDELVRGRGGDPARRGRRGPGRHARDGDGEARGALRRRGELRFAPGGDRRDPRGGGWRSRASRPLELDLATARDERTYPDALGRLWSALECPHSGDVLVSAEPGYEFVDWGGADHVGGGSHGSLHRDDSEGVLLLCGVEAPEREQWSLTDVTRWCSSTSVYRCRVTEELDRRRHAPAPAHVRVRAGLRKSHNWRQLVKFCIVGGSGYVVNLCVFALFVSRCWTCTT